jgi:competence/damage-inducible protein CinA-like protein
MPILEIITIGTELLLGEIQDTNSTYIARTLRDHGIDIYRITTIGDNPKRIASAIQEALTRADIIITTGGLGPTIDDPTRQAVADAVNQDLVFLEELWNQIKARFKDYGREPTENNRRQAYIPKSAIPIHNPVGTAPCFIVDRETSCIVSLPGVPSEMKVVLHQSIIPFLKQKYNLKNQIIKATVLHAASIGESTIDEKIGDLEENVNPTVGLLAHPGQVDIRVTAKAPSEAEALALSEPVVQELQNRLGDNIYGQDEETLESVVCNLLNLNNLKLCLVESGLDLGLIKRIKLAQPDEMAVQTLEQTQKISQAIKEQIRTAIEKAQCDVAFGIALIMNEKVIVHFIYKDMQSMNQKTRTYGGPRDYAPLWAQNTGLDFLRRHLVTTIDNQKTGVL